MPDNRQGLVIFEAFPVQYHAPVYAAVAAQIAAAGVTEPVRVAYSTIATATGFKDREFGKVIGWGGSVLDGYEHDVLGNHAGGAMSGRFLAHRAAGVGAYLDRLRPRVVLLSSLFTAYDLAALWHARRIGAEVWLRTETQDCAGTRSWAKELARTAFYRSVYSQIDRFYCIGELNRAHYRAYGADERRLARASYCTVDRIGSGEALSETNRRAIRARLGIADDRFVLLFSGKLIPKKYPDIIPRAIARLPEDEQRRITVVYCGDGELGDELKGLGSTLTPATDYRFAGFVGQEDLPDWYLAADCLALPSRLMGETWGLVVNEAMQAGAKVIASNAVGSTGDLWDAPGVEVFANEDIDDFAEALERQMASTVDRRAVRAAIEPYSIEAAAREIAADFVQRATR